MQLMLFVVNYRLMNMFCNSCKRRNLSVDPLYFGRWLVNIIQCIPICDYYCWEWTVLQYGIVEFFYLVIFANECSFLLKRFHNRRKENPIHFDVNRYHKSIVSMDSWNLEKVFSHIKWPVYFLRDYWRNSYAHMLLIQRFGIWLVC